MTFDRDSTAHDVLDGLDLSGTTALVTGGYSGLGLETTKALHAAGARVIVPARRPEAARAAVGDLAQVRAADLADLNSVRAFADGLLDAGERLGIIIANAGVMACPETRVGPRWELQLAVNHLGHFALVHRLLPLLDQGSRVASVTSAGHFLSDIRWDDPSLIGANTEYNVHPRIAAYIAAGAPATPSATAIM